MTKKFLVTSVLLVLLAFAIPIEHKYDKLFRFYSLTLIPQGLEISKQFDKKIYFYVSDLIALLLTCLGLFWFRIPVRRFFGHPLWIVFICALASIVASPFVHYPIPYIRLLQLFTPLALFSFVAFAFTEEEKEKMTYLLLCTFVAAGLFQTAIGIAQYFYEAPLGLRLLGESNAINTVGVAEGYRWIFDRLFDIHLPSVEKMRAAGTLPHANIFGGFLLISILSTYALIVRGISFLKASLPFQFFALSLSYSRSAFFGLILANTIWFCLMFLKKGAKDQTVRQLLLIAICSLAATGFLLQDQIAQRGGIVNYNPTVQASDSVRKVQQNLSLKILRENPLFGVGYSQYSERAPAYYPKDLGQEARVTAPHNIYLFLATETGLISVSAFIIFLLLLFRATLQAPLSLEIATFSALLAGFLFISLCDFYPILFQQGKLLFFFIAALLAAHVQFFNKKIGGYVPNSVS